MNIVLVLQQQGVTKKVAEKLAQTYSQEYLLAQVQMLPFRAAKNPAAMLVKAIKENWSPPSTYLDQQKEITAYDKEKEKKRWDLEKRRASIQSIEAVKKKLGKLEWQELREEAIQRVPQVLRERYGDDRVPEVLVKALMNDVIRERFL